MAQMIAFYIPASFSFKAKQTPQEERGKVIAFSSDLRSWRSYFACEYIEDSFCGLPLPESLAYEADGQEISITEDMDIFGELALFEQVAIPKPHN